MSVQIIIPARYASSRFPGKPLAELTGASGISRSLIERSWRAAMDVKGADGVFVATDDQRIAEASRAFGAEVLMTPESCRNGTERCAAALPQLPSDTELVVNLQGDAPLTPAWFVDALIERMQTSGEAAEVATPVLRCDAETLEALRADRRAGRVGGTTAVVGPNAAGLYFSKEVLPYGGTAEPGGAPVFHHVGLYAYGPAALRRYMAAEPSPLELAEGLEQLRFLALGVPVACVEVEARSRVFWELNNPSDIEKVEAGLRAAGIE